MKTVKIWTVATSAEGAAGNAELGVLLFNVESAADVIRDGRNGVFGETQSGLERWYTYPVTLTIEVGEPAEKGG